MKRLPVLALMAISLSVFTIAMVVHKWSGFGLRRPPDVPGTVVANEDPYGPADPPRMTPEEEAEFVRETVRRVRDEIRKTHEEYDRLVNERKGARIDVKEFIPSRINPYHWDTADRPTVKETGWMLPVWDPETDAEPIPPPGVKAFPSLPQADWDEFGHPVDLPD